MSSSRQSRVRHHTLLRMQVLHASCSLLMEFSSPPSPYSSTRFIIHLQTCALMRQALVTTLLFHCFPCQARSRSYTERLYMHDRGEVGNAAKSADKGSSSESVNHDNMYITTAARQFLSRAPNHYLRYTVHIDRWHCARVIAHGKYERCGSPRP